MRKHRRQPDRGKSGGKPVRPLAAPLVVRPGDEIAAVDLTRINLPEAIPVSLEPPTPDGMDDLEDVTDLMGPPPGMHGAPLGYNPGVATNEFDQHGLGFDPDDMPMFPTMRRSTPLPLLDATRLPEPVEQPLPATPAAEAHPVVAPLLDDLDGGHMFHDHALPLDASRYRSEPMVEATEAVADPAGWETDPTDEYGGWQPAAEIAPLYADEPETGFGEGDMSLMEPHPGPVDADDEIGDLVEALAPLPAETGMTTDPSSFQVDTAVDEPGATIPDALRLHEDDEPLWKPRHRGNPAPDESPAPVRSDPAHAHVTTLTSPSTETTHLSLIEGISDLESSAFDDRPVTALADLTLELSDTGTLDAVLPIEASSTDEPLVFTLDNHDPAALHVDLPESLLGHPLTLVVPTSHDHTHDLGDHQDREDLALSPALDAVEASEPVADESHDYNGDSRHEAVLVDEPLDEAEDQKVDLTEDLPGWALTVDAPAPLNSDEEALSVATPVLDGFTHGDIEQGGTDEQPTWTASDLVTDHLDVQAWSFETESRQIGEDSYEGVVALSEPQVEVEVEAEVEAEAAFEEPQTEVEAEEPQVEVNAEVHADDPRAEVEEPQAETEAEEPQAAVDEPQAEDHADEPQAAVDEPQAETEAEEPQVEADEPQAEDHADEPQAAVDEPQAEAVFEEPQAEVHADEPHAEVEVEEPTVPSGDVHRPAGHRSPVVGMRSMRESVPPARRRGERMRESAFAAIARLQGRTAAEWVEATEGAEDTVLPERETRRISGRGVHAGDGRWQVPDAWAGTDENEVPVVAAVSALPPVESPSIFDQIAADSGFRPLSVGD